MKNIVKYNFSSIVGLSFWRPRLTSGHWVNPAKRKYLPTINKRQ